MYAILTFVVVFFLEFIFFMPTLNAAFPDFYGAIGVASLFATFVTFWCSNYSDNKKILKIGFLTSTIISFLILIVVWVFTGSFFRANDYRALLGTVKESVFTSDISPTSLENIRLIDQETAKNIGDKRHGEAGAIGSITQLGEFTLQKVNNELRWVAPLLHSGFGQWWTHSKGTNGYVSVSTTNINDVKLIQHINGKEIWLKYQTNAYWFDDLEIHMYFKGYAHKGLTDISFEVNDEGYPYWVVTVYKPTIGWSGNNAEGVLLVDPQTGDMKYYDIKDAPAWIDCIQPDNFVKNQINNWGQYVHGFTWTDQTDQLQTAHHPHMIFGEDGRAYWYVGMTSRNSDKGTTGFLMVNTRNKEATWYKLAGATEDAAKKSAQGKVAEKKYRASEPIPYNILGTPTYVFPLKDEASLIKSIAFVNVADHNTVGVGDTLEQALRAYMSSLSSSGNSLVPHGTIETINIKGQITRFASDVAGGQTYYYFMIDTLPNRLLIGTSGISKVLPITKIGDSVEVTFNKTSMPDVNIILFKHMDIVLLEQPAQERVWQRNQQVKSQARDTQIDKDANKKWSELTPEEKAKALKGGLR